MASILSRQSRAQIAVAPKSAPISIPAPVKGWNARDEFDAMDPLDAVLLDNWYPDAGGLFLRNGYKPYATGLGAAVKTLVQFSAGSSQKFLGAANGNIFDISAAGAVGAPLATGFGSDAWQTVNFNSRLFLANGTDTMQVYNGSVLANSTFSGVTLSTLIGGAQYQQRLYFWQAASTGFWYAPLNAITGALAFYDLAGFLPRGGNLTAITTITHDGGNGVQDFIAFIFSTGDMVLFYGNDPSNAANWQMIGRYRLSPPVSPRAVATYGGDSFVTTFDDHLPMQQQLVALKVGSLPPRSKVSTAVQQAVAANKTGFGWQALYYPKGRRLIFNIPNTDGTFSQHVCNTGLPDAPWCRFVNMNAQCWGLFGDNLYFGTASGTVYQADVGNLDNFGAITGTAQQSWNKLGSPQRKRLTAVKPVVQSVGSAAYNFSVGFDYGALNILAPLATTATGSPWDVSPWDISPWSADYQITGSWQAGGGTGTAIGFALSAASVEPMVWMRTDLRMELGSAL